MSGSVCIREWTNYQVCWLSSSAWPPARSRLTSAIVIYINPGWRSCGGFLGHWSPNCMLRPPMEDWQESLSKNYSERQTSIILVLLLQLQRCINMIIFIMQWYIVVCNFLFCIESTHLWFIHILCLLASWKSSPLLTLLTDSLMWVGDLNLPSFRKAI